MSSSVPSKNPISFSGVWSPHTTVPCWWVLNCSGHEACGQKYNLSWKQWPQWQLKTPHIYKHTCYSSAVPIGQARYVATGTSCRGEVFQVSWQNLRRIRSAWHSQHNWVIRSKLRNGVVLGFDASVWALWSQPRSCETRNVWVLIGDWGTLLKITQNTLHPVTHDLGKNKALVTSDPNYDANFDYMTTSILESGAKFSLCLGSPKLKTWDQRCDVVG